MGTNEYNSHLSVTNDFFQKGGIGMTQSTKKTTAVESFEKNGVMYYNGQYSDVITPLIVDLNDIFENRITLYLNKYVKKDAKIAVNIGTGNKMHNVTGTISSIKEKNNGFEAILEVDFIPNGLVKDLEEALSLGTLLHEEGWE
jgi:hypothetical protein